MKSELTYQPHLLGKLSEDAACAYLERQGLQLVTRNYRCTLGEIDLIMRDGNVIVFVEVRARGHSNFSSALESVTQQKRSKIIKTAMFYLQKQRLFNKCVCRFDVVAVITRDGRIECKWIKQAFEC